MDKNLKYYLIFNPMANHGRAAKKIPSVEEYFNNRGVLYDLAVTKKPKEAVSLARQASKEYEVVLAIGGDGTINEVVNGIIGSKVVLGIIPVGAGNDFSKALGLKRNLKENLEIILRNKVRKVDIGQVNDIYFINVLGIGFDAMIAEEMTKRPKFLKGISVYLYSLLKSLKKYKFTELKIKTDDLEEKKEYLMVAVSNGTFFGGGFNITPKASIKDGLFDIALIDAMKKNTY